MEISCQRQGRGYVDMVNNMIDDYYYVSLRGCGQRMCVPRIHAKTRSRDPSRSVTSRNALQRVL